MTIIEQNEILPELSSKIIDIKFTQIEDDPHQIELDSNIFHGVNFFARKAYEIKNQLT